MEEADALCQRLAIIDHGKNIALAHRGTKGFGPGRLSAALRFGQHSPEMLQVFSPGGVREVRQTTIIPPTCMPIAGLARRGDCNLARAPRWNCATCTFEPSLENLFLHHTEGACAIELDDFLSVARRDAHVARRNIVPLLLQTFLQR